jgi:hypothetical protein
MKEACFFMYVSGFSEAKRISGDHSVIVICKRKERKKCTLFTLLGLRITNVEGFVLISKEKITAKTQRREINSEVAKMRRSEIYFSLRLCVFAVKKKLF